MGRTALLVLGSSALALTRAAPADLVGTIVEWSPEQHPDPRVATLRLYLVFDHPDDELLAVSGNADVSPLVFSNNRPLEQNERLEDSILCDVPGDCDLGGDSWVTIGEEFFNADVRFSPGLMGGDGVRSVIKGSFFSQPDNGGYYNSDPGVHIRAHDTGKILVAQFSLPDHLNDGFFRGTADYVPGLVPRGFVSEAFSFDWRLGTCVEDVDHDGRVDVRDVVALLAAWGPNPPPCPPFDRADLDADCDVGIADLLQLLSAWGPCR